MMKIIQGFLYLFLNWISEPTQYTHLSQPMKEISTERKLYLDVTLRYGILSMQAAITWCDEVIDLLRSS